MMNFNLLVLVISIEVNVKKYKLQIPLKVTVPEGFSNKLEKAIAKSRPSLLEVAARFKDLKYEPVVTERQRLKIDIEYLKNKLKVLIHESLYDNCIKYCSDISNELNICKNEDLKKIRFRLRQMKMFASFGIPEVVFEYNEFAFENMTDEILLFLMRQPIPKRIGFLQFHNSLYSETEFVEKDKPKKHHIKKQRFK